MSNDGQSHSVAVDRATAEHYQWGDGCDGWHLVKNQQLSVIEETMPPGTAEVRHYHERAQQFFYVLSGEVVMEAEQHEKSIKEGTGIWIGPGVCHQIRNVASSPARFLVISQPPSHGDRFNDG